MADPYRVLGVRRDATQDEIKRAFTALALALHPDTAAAPARGAAAAPAEQAAERFARAKEAFDVLRDAGRRAAHDRRVSGFAGGGAGGAAGAPGYSAEDLRRRAEEFEQWRRAQPPRPSGAGAGAGSGAGAGFAGDFGAAPASGAFRAASGQALLMQLVERALRPRSVAALLALPAAVWLCTAALAREADVTGEAYGGAGAERVRAWFNPRSQQWEPPAPWDPLFEAHRAHTKMVPRREVRPSTLAAAPVSVAAAVAASEGRDSERFVAAAMPAAAAAASAAAAAAAAEAAAGAASPAGDAEPAVAAPPWPPELGHGGAVADGGSIALR